MENIDILAIAKGIKAKLVKDAREKVDAGKYEVDTTVRVKGTVNIGEDYEQQKTAAMPQQKMLLAALMLNGVSVKAFTKRYLDGEFEVSEEKEKEMKEIWEELAGNFTATFKGKVTSKLEIEQV